MPRTFNAPVLVGAGALLRLRVGEAAQNTPGWSCRVEYAGLGCRVAGEAPVTRAVKSAGRRRGCV